MILLDTDVMIDILRGFPAALNWLKSVAPEEIGIPGLVAMELLQGCSNRQEQRRVEKVIRPQELYWPDETDCDRAFRDFTQFHLSHNIGLLDALIAETAVGLGVGLATFNEKHLHMIASLQRVQPYAKQQ